MSVNAGQILTVGGNAVLQRVQEQGLGNVQIPQDVVRETGNPDVVDKIVTEPDFTFTLNSLDVSCDLEALLHGKIAPGGASGASFPDPDGTEYKWEDCQTVNIVSPWRDSNSATASACSAGHIIPSFYPTQVKYSFGVTQNATQEAQLNGGAFYYGKFAPVEQFDTGDGATTAFVTASAAIHHRLGGVEGTTFKPVFGVLVDGVPQVIGVDFTLSGGALGPAGAAATVTFTVAPANGASVRFTYFTPTPQAFGPSVRRSAVVLPGAVRGRNICISIASAVGAPWQKIASIQTFELTATVTQAAEREFCNEEVVGRTIEGTDVNGTAVIRARDRVAFFGMLKQFTGLNTDQEVVGYINQNAIRLKAEIQNPKNPGAVLKTLFVPDAIFEIPGTPARVNTPTDFSISWASRTGTYSAFKGAMP